MKNKYNWKNYYNAIAYCPGDIESEAGTKPTAFKKFHSIKKTDAKQGAFIEFVKTKFPSCQYVNFYDKLSKQFIERIYTS